MAVRTQPEPGPDPVRLCTTLGFRLVLRLRPGRPKFLGLECEHLDLFFVELALVTKLSALGVELIGLDLEQFRLVADFL